MKYQVELSECLSETIYTICIADFGINVSLIGTSDDPDSVRVHFLGGDRTDFCKHYDLYHEEIVFLKNYMEKNPHVKRYNDYID